jgi:TM2 domain-containing membrane protein YozV
MSHEDTIYDLGEIAREERAVLGAGSARLAGTAARPRPVPHPSAVGAGVGPALAGSLSIFVPGLGQMLAGEIAWGLFYLSGIGFCAAVIWSVLASLDRIVPTLRLLDVPLEALVVTVGSLVLFTIILHLAAVMHAHAQAPGAQRDAPHPLVAALASLMLPGWGQLLAGHRRRAGLFLGGVWILGSAWLLVTTRGTTMLTRLGHPLPAAMRDGWGPVVLLAAPLVLWVIAVYDGASGAAAERRI